MEQCLDDASCGLSYVVRFIILLMPCPGLDCLVLSLLAIECFSDRLLRLKASMSLAPERTPLNRTQKATGRKLRPPAPTPASTAAATPAY